MNSLRNKMFSSRLNKPVTKGSGNLESMSTSNLGVGGNPTVTVTNQNGVVRNAMKKEETSVNKRNETSSSRRGTT